MISIFLLAIVLLQWCISQIYNMVGVTVAMKISTMKEKFRLPI